MISYIQIGPIQLHFYGILIMLGVVAAAWLATVEAKRRKLNPDLVWDMLPWLVIAGIIGARLWHIFTPTPLDIEAGRTTMFYLTHPLDAINLLNGGLGIPGAVIGGVIAMLIYARRHQLNLLVWMDVAAPGLILAQAIGRWGNFFNQELYGMPTSLPWGIYIDPVHRLPGFEQFTTFHPLFLYESLWNLFTMGVLLFIARRFGEKLKNGDIFLIYCMMYPFARFMLDFLRPNNAQTFGLNSNQVVMAVVFIAALLLLFLRHRPGQKLVQGAE